MNRVNSIKIERPYNYSGEPIKPLEGEVEIITAVGKQQIKLSYGAINRILGVIASELVESARKQAVDAKTAISDSAEELTYLQNDPLLIEGSKGG